MNESTESKEAQHGMVLPKDGLRELALFAGAGGGILGGLLHGWRTVAAVEIEDYPRRVLLQRQADGILPRFPIWDDVCTFDGSPWRGKVDVISGGFPCQDISCAGKGEGIDGERSGLWGEMARIIGEVRPRYVFVENSPMLTVRGLGVVLGALAQMGYNARWGIFSAAECGAMHIRQRIFLLATADTERDGLQGWHKQTEKGQRKIKIRPDAALVEDYNGYTRPRPKFHRKANAIPCSVDRLKAIGNAQVPAVAALAWQILADQTEQA